MAWPTGDGPGAGDDGAHEPVERPEISVVVPTYNRSAELRRCLESVIASDFDAWECVVVDDGSQPAWAHDVVTQLGDPRLRLIVRRRNAGVAVALNDGVQHSRGRFVTMCGDDDELTPTFMSESHRRLSELGSEAVAVECWIRYKSNGNSWATPPAVSGLTRAELMMLTRSVFVVGLLITRSAIPARPFDEELRAFEDWDFIARLDLARVHELSAEGVVVHVDDIPRLSTSPAMVQGFERLREKYRGELSSSPRLQARWSFALACLKARHGDLAGSRREMAAAARAAPTLKAWALLATSLVGLDTYGSAVRRYLDASQQRGGRVLAHPPEGA